MFEKISVIVTKVKKPRKDELLMLCMENATQEMMDRLNSILIREGFERTIILGGEVKAYYVKKPEEFIADTGKVST